MPGPLRGFSAGTLPVVVLNLWGLSAFGVWLMSPSFVPSIVPNGSDETFYLVTTILDHWAYRSSKPISPTLSTSKPRSGADVGGIQQSASRRRLQHRRAMGRRFLGGHRAGDFAPPRSCL